MIRTGLLVLAAALLLALPFLSGLAGQPFWVGVATRFLIFAIAAVSLDLILGYGGMVSFGHAAFVGIGAYTVAILADSVASPAIIDTALLGSIRLPGTTSAFVTMPAAALAAGLAALLIGLVSLRTSGIYFIMITLAFAQMIYFFFVSLDRFGGDDGLALSGRSSTAGLLDLDDPVAFYYVVLGVLVLVLLFFGLLVRARFGRVIEGARENDRRMQALGFPTFRYKLACFTLAGAVAGVAGALLANATEFVSPGFLHWTRSGELMVMVILGGAGTLFGPILGAAAYLLLEETLSAYTKHWGIVFGPLLVLVVLLARRGLIGIGRRGGAP